MIRVLNPLFLLLSISSLLLLPQISAAEDYQKTVLILHSYHPGHTWTDDIMSGVREGFGEEMNQINFHVEYLDTQRYRSSEYYDEILHFIIHYKLGGKHFDLVLLSDNDALELVLKHRDDLFADTAIVFCGINNYRSAMIAGVRDISGVAEYPSYRDTIATALGLHPGTNLVVVVGGLGNLTDIENRNMLKSVLAEKPFDPAVRFLFWDDLPADELTYRLGRLPPGSLVLLNGTVSMRPGEPLTYQEGIRLLSNSTSIPLYSFWDFFLGEGIVGGKLISGKQQGRMASQIALRVLAGEDLEHIPVETGPNRYMFDYKQLEKFGISIRNLPHESIIINRPLPFYALSKGQLWAVLALLTALSLLLLADIQVRRRTQRKLQEQKERFNLLLNSAAEGIYGLDLQGTCTFCNPAALSMLGYSCEENLLGKRIHDLIHHTRPDDTPYSATECRICHSDRHEENLHVEDEVFWRADGSRFPVEYWSHPIRKDGRIIGTVVTFLDISERKAAEEKTKEAVRELNAFVYTVSHDLRAPLSAVIGFADFLRQNYSQSLDENGLTALQAIESEGERVEGMMNDLLSLSQVGKLPVPVKGIDLNELVKKVLEDLSRQVSESGLEVRVTHLPCVRIPETLLFQIFSNLIGNALRYAGEKGGPIKVEGERCDSMVRLWIRDHGPGIPLLERAKVFDVFYRGSSGRGRPGNGIGLATVHKIVRLYGGNITIEDTPGGGATLRVEISDS